MRFRDVNEIVAHIIAQVTGDSPREPEQLEFVTFYELRAASIMARIPMRIAMANANLFQQPRNQSCPCSLNRHQTKTGRESSRPFLLASFAERWRAQCCDDMPQPGLEWRQCS